MLDLICQTKMDAHFERASQDIGLIYSVRPSDESDIYKYISAHIPSDGRTDTYYIIGQVKRIKLLNYDR